MTGRLVDQTAGPPRGVRLRRVLEGPGGPMTSLAFDRQGRVLAAGAALWDTAAGRMLRTLEGKETRVLCAAFDPSGRALATGGRDGAVKLWKVADGKLLRTYTGHQETVLSLDFEPASRMLATGGADGTVRLWEAGTGQLLRTTTWSGGHVYCVAFHPSGATLAGAGDGGVVKLWGMGRGGVIHALQGHAGSVLSLAFDPPGEVLASCGDDRTVRLWDVSSGRLLRTLEGHTSGVCGVAFSPNGRVLASKSYDGALRLWNCETWETVAVIPERAAFEGQRPSLAFHPSQPLFASVSPRGGRDAGEQINLWEINYAALLDSTDAARGSAAKRARGAVHHTTAKIVLVGDHSVGKSALGWRLAHGEFKEQSATHGQQFWVLPQLREVREDRTECEAILWDLAGQPDYRLIHALFLDDVDLALVLFDSSDISDPLHGVEFWLQQLKAGRDSAQAETGSAPAACRTLLVGAQADRGTPALTREELDEFCRQRDIEGYLSTSAKDGLGIEELVERMKELIPWEDKAATVTTITFKRIKDYVLRLKESGRRKKVIVTPQELRQQLEKAAPDEQFTDAEMMTAVGHLENYGYVKRLRTSKGETRVLLAPELLNNLAASFVLEARQNPKGLGALEEKRLLAGEYPLPELEKLPPAERDILLDAAGLLFLQHNICFREINPLGGQSYLVFPELINLKKPALEDETKTEDGVSYAVTGVVKNVYASLVVLLGYTQTFTRADQWQKHARYQMGDGSICGFRQEGDGDDELELVLYFGEGVPKAGRKVFEGLFESFLARHNVTVFRYEPVACPDGHTISRATVREFSRASEPHVFCAKCGKKTRLPKADAPILLTQTESRKVNEQRRVAEERTRFEQAVFRLASYVEARRPRPRCFISYAWGDGEQERWVEHGLAKDLQKAGIDIVLDRWENARVGSSVARFVERIEQCDRVIVVGTPPYLKKYENQDDAAGYVVAAEVDLIARRMLGPEDEKKTVMPLLLEGDEGISLPPMLRRRVYADFRDGRAYFTTAFDLILDLYGIQHQDKAVADLRESLRDSVLS